MTASARLHGTDPATPVRARASRPYDEALMDEAIAEAERGRGRTSPNPLVGALIVDESGPEPRILSRGFHARAGLDHGERAALRALGERAEGMTLYVTLEPCNHVGRTGKCTDAILAAGLRRVVIGMLDPNPRVAGGGAALLRERGLEVDEGILEERCREQNRGYLSWTLRGRPHLLMKAAISLDGRLAPRAQRAPLSTRHDGGQQFLTSAPARQLVHHLRDEQDAILVGAGTVLADDPQLTVRLADPGPAANRPAREKQPLRVVLDGALRVPAAARIAQPGTLLFTSEQALSAQRSQATALRERGVEVAALPTDGGTQLELRAVLDALGQRGILYALCEGGAALHAALLRAGLYDEAALFVAPLFLGETAVPLVEGLGELGVAQAPWLAGLRAEALPPDLLLRGRLRAPPYHPSSGPQPSPAATEVR